MDSAACAFSWSVSSDHSVGYRRSITVEGDFSQRFAPTGLASRRRLWERLITPPAPSSNAPTALAAMTFAAVVYADFSYRVAPDLYCTVIAAVAVLAPWRLGLGEIGVGVLICAGLLAGLAFIWRTLRSGDGIGGGDVKLAAAVGAMLGPQMGLFALSLSAALVVIVALLARLVRKPADSDEPPLLPYGAALALAGMAFLANSLL
ncbi:MAG: prepilin peptidase [Deltaproteobacteria bacterium]|nr:MAG: prepilin peptidase [Deltaproteobacteria bacterium]